MSPLKATDDRLVHLAASGEESAFAQIYERYHQPVYRYCLSILRDAEEARDALQSTMERALRSIGSQRVVGGLRAWLFMIAHNEAMTAIGKRTVQAPAGEEPLVADAAAEAGERARLRQLLADLGSLPEQQREALVLRELSGLESAEIGTALGISPSAARQSVYEARVALTTIAEGRDMSCTHTQQRISDGDGRNVRGRRVRAHLRDCAICQAFTAQINTRTADFPCLFPPLAAAAAAKTMAAVTGGGAVDAAAATPAGGDASTGSGLAGRRKTAVGATVLLLLVLGGTLGVLRGDDARAPSRAAAAADPPKGAASPKTQPVTAPPAARAPEAQADPSLPSSVAGYTQLEPSLAGLMEDDRPGSGDDGAGANGQGGSLPFTGLDASMLLLAGAVLLALGVLTRRLSSSPQR